MKRWGTLTFSHGRLEGDDSLEEAIEHWRQADVDGLIMRDLDGVDAPRNLVAASKVVASGLPVRYWGGMHSLLDLQRTLDLGVVEVVVGTRAIRHPEWTVEAAQIFPGKLLLGLELRGDEALLDGRTESLQVDPARLAARVMESGWNGIVYAEISDGRVRSPEIHRLDELVECGPTTVCIEDDEPGGVAANAVALSAR